MPTRQERAGSSRSGKLLSQVAEHAFLVALAVIVIMPLVIIATTALMTPAQAMTGDLWPQPLTLSNFPEVLRRIPFIRYFTNTVLIACLTALFTVLSSVPAAYALATLRFRGRNWLFLLIVATMMLPGQVVVIPLYVMYAQLHLVGTPIPLLLPSLFMDAFSIFLLRQFFVSVPRSYIESARIDGASELRIMLQVFLPMVKSAVAAVALFAFFYAWNDYFNPLLYLSSNENWHTLSLALAGFKGSHGVEWNLMMAATMLFILPVLLIFFFAQKAFVEGISLTGVKG